MWRPQGELDRRNSMQSLRLGSASSTDSLDELLSEVGRFSADSYFCKAVRGWITPGEDMPCNFAFPADCHMPWHFPAWRFKFLDRSEVWVN